MIARHLSIHGRVQGVFYRSWAVRTARELGLTGWVRNRHDGTVEAVVQGAREEVEHFIEQARDGPPSAKVTSVEVGECDVTDFADFRQRPTA
jgi:acylphosphatase